jgi:HSP20 family protein
MANIMLRRNPESRVPAVSSLFAPWEPMRFLEDFWSGDPFREMLPVQGASLSNFVPAFEVLDNKDSYLFRADMPGVNQADIDISVTGNRLTISGKREQEQEEKSGRYYHRERSYGTFTRVFTLPEGTDLEHIRAELKDGVLTVVVPKGPELASRKVQVNTQSPQAGQQARA